METALPLKIRPPEKLVPGTVRLPRSVWDWLDRKAGESATRDDERVRRSHALRDALKQLMEAEATEPPPEPKKGGRHGK
jgi:hypothetical protein